MYLCRCNFLSVTPLPSHCLLHIAKRLTHAQSQFPVTNLTPFIGYNTGWAEYIIMRALTFIIKSLFVVVVCACVVTRELCVSAGGYYRRAAVPTFQWLWIPSAQTGRGRVWRHSRGWKLWAKRKRVRMKTLFKPRSLVMSHISLLSHRSYTSFTQNDASQMIWTDWVLRNGWRKLLVLMKSQQLKKINP